MRSPLLLLLAIFGRRSVPTPHAIPSQALTALTEPADAMRTILSARLAHLRVIASLWAAGGAERALTKVRHSTPRAPLPSLLQAHSAAAHRRWTSTSCQCSWTF